MAKVRYDVSKAEVRNFQVPKPGVYEATITEAEYGKSKQNNDMFTIVFELTKEFKGTRIWYYILNDGTQDWRLREFTDALDLPPKGDLDPDMLKGHVVQLRTGIEPERDGFDEKARVKNVMAAVGSVNGASASDDEEEPPYEEWELDDLKEEAEARDLKITGKATKAKLVKALEKDDEEAESEEGEEEEDEEPEAKATKSKSKASKSAEPEEEEDEDEDEEGDLTLEDLKGMDRGELRELIKEEGLKIKVTSRTKDDALREKIAEALELEEEEEEGKDDEEEDGDDYTMADLKKLDRAGLRKLIKEEELDVVVGRKTSEDALREKVAEALEIGKEEEEEEEPEKEEEDTDYEEWDLSDLKSELQERGLKTDGRKSILVARLKKDDDSDEPF